MRLLQSPLLLAATLLPLLALADTNIPPGLELANVTFAYYYTFVSPSAAGPKLGSMSFEIINDAVGDAVSCLGHSTHAWAMFYPQNEIQCDWPRPDADAACVTKDASFSLDTMTPGEMNLTVTVSWACAGEGTYTLSAWEKLVLDCRLWTCTNGLWPKGTVYSNTTMECEPSTIGLGGENTRVQKME